VLVAPDLNFFHGKGCLVARSGAGFVAAIRGACANQRPGTAMKIRRELIAGSGLAYRLGRYGALAVGRHHFFHQPLGQSE
jgi:hypothetical protein